jgi:hypothetical protein
VLQELLVIDSERRKLRLLEQQMHGLEVCLESGSKEEEITLLDQCRREQEVLDNQRRLVEDLEFNQLEVGILNVNSLK